jgi:HTH-type transcriptional regulator/antitoxin HigA
MKLRPLRTDTDLQDALRQAEKLWGAAPGSPEAEQLELLTILIERYENEKWPIEESDPIDILHYAFTEMGHSQAELSTLLGSRSRASEIMSRKRPLTLEMIRKISAAWHIPIALLARPYALATKEAQVAG